LPLCGEKPLKQLISSSQIIVFCNEQTTCLHALYAHKIYYVALPNVLDPTPSHGDRVVKKILDGHQQMSDVAEFLLLNPSFRDRYAPILNTYQALIVAEMPHILWKLCKGKGASLWCDTVGHDDCKYCFFFALKY